MLLHQVLEDAFRNLLGSLVLRAVQTDGSLELTDMSFVFLIHWSSEIGRHSEGTKNGHFQADEDHGFT